ELFKTHALDVQLDNFLDSGSKFAVECSLDEPLSALDPDLRAGLSRELRRILTETGTGAVYVTHDRAEADVVADGVAVVEDGRLTAPRTP
ncbi:MAG: hypothetical protein ACFNKK_03605, partial [Peptidiphaga sp.]